MNHPIQLIGSRSGESLYCAEDISRLLASPQIGLSFGAEFMGRPGTKVYTCEAHVLKLRDELRLKEKVARRWCQHALERERKFALHHPDKTWFLAVLEEGGEAGDVAIGNVCPRLAPLHGLMQAPPATPEDRAQRLAWLEAVLDMDLRLAVQEKTRLDLGLSNFGLDAQGGLFYLDDDFYKAEGWVAFAQMLGVYLRSHAWMDEDFAAGLGDCLNSLLRRHFADPHCLTVLAGQLNGLFMQGGERQAALSALVRRLLAREARQHAAFPSRSPGRHTHRYFALLADVHANLPALEAALGFLDKEGIREGLVLGDYVGYGPHPVECIQRLQDSKLDLALLRGNHDHAAATGLYEHGFSNSARWCLEWTIPRLDEGHKAWLLGLPVFLEGEDWLAVHGAPLDPSFFNAYVYNMTYSQNLDALEQRGIALCFHGHTHMQGVYTRNKRREDAFRREGGLALAGHRHCLICPGSVGQPRNGESGAQLAVLDWETRELKFVSLAYDVESTVRDMEREGFPSALSSRLPKGL